jgi:xanthine dehydrogenase accessory factor
MRLDILKAMNAARRERRAGALATRLSDGEQRFVAAEAVPADPLAEALEAALRSGKSGLVEHAGESWFLTVLVPPVRLVMIGAVHISQALAPIAKIAGLDATIIDPRTAFATPERFPDAPLIAQWPDEALAAAPLDRYTAICLLTHDPKIDDRALVRALQADCFYIGALGSRKTHAKRIERMRAEGFHESALARIHAPIGLDIGAVSPAEIAVSIMGEIVAALRKKPLRAERGQGAAS